MLGVGLRCFLFRCLICAICADYTGRLVMYVMCATTLAGRQRLKHKMQPPVVTHECAASCILALVQSYKEKQRHCTAAFSGLRAAGQCWRMVMCDGNSCERSHWPDLMSPRTALG